MLSTFSWGQNDDTSWIGHFSYLNIKEVVQGDTKFYAASENSILSYDPSTNQLETITTLNGLSGELISTIHYSSNYQLLLIGYENGLIEVFKDTEKQVLKVIDVINKTTIPSSQKKINHFNELGNVVYIATDYGISVYNLENLEFGDTYYIGTNGTQVSVNQTAVFNNELYAACGYNTGLKKASLSNANLIDFKFWDLVVSGDFKFIGANATSLYTIKSNDILYKIEGSTLEVKTALPQSVLELKLSDDSVLVSTPSVTEEGCAMEAS